MSESQGAPLSSSGIVAQQIDEATAQLAAATGLPPIVFGTIWSAGVALAGGNALDGRWDALRLRWLVTLRDRPDSAAPVDDEADRIMVACGLVLDARFFVACPPPEQGQEGTDSARAAPSAERGASGARPEGAAAGRLEHLRATLSKRAQLPPDAFNVALRAAYAAAGGPWSMCSQASPAAWGALEQGWLEALERAPREAASTLPPDAAPGKLDQLTTFSALILHAIDWLRRSKHRGAFVEPDPDQPEGQADAN